MAKHTIPARLYRSRHGVWYWRLTIPLPLRSKAGHSEIRLSTGTESRVQALLCAQQLNLMADELFRELDATVSTEKSLSTVLKLQQKLVRTRMQLEEQQQTAEDLDFERRKEIARLQPKPAPLFSEAASAFIKAESERKAWKPKTLEAHRAVHRLFIACNGDIPSSQITREMMIDFSETLRKLPPNYNKLAATRGKSIDAVVKIAKKQSIPAMSAVTSNKTLERLGSLIDWCSLDARYGVAANAAQRLTVRETQKKPVERFTDDEIKRIFQSPRITGDQVTSSYNFWLPVIAVYTGARLNEICQLELSDFTILNGVHCILITDQPSDEFRGARKQIKNENAKRFVPIHSQLIELGLLEHVESLRAYGEVKLFPEIKPRRDGHGAIPGKWFGRVKTSVGIKEKRVKCLHSFRHTFISTILDTGIEEHKLAPIVGHEAKLITGKVYWQNKDAKPLKTTTELFRLPLDIEKLIPQWKEIKLAKRPGPKPKAAKSSEHKKHKPKKRNK